MKRLAFALAAAVLGTGCHSSSTFTPPPVVGSVNLYWDFFRNAPAQNGGAVLYDSTFQGTVTGPCVQSRVEFVTVDTVNGQVQVDCVFGPSHAQGVGIDGLPAGTNSFRVRGWRHINASDIAVYDDTFSRNVPANAVQDHFLDVVAVSAPFDLFAALYNTGAAQFYTLCADALNPVIDFDVRDSFGTLVLSSSAACSDPAYPSFPVFVGDLDLDGYTARMKGFTGATPTRTFDSCLSDAATLMAFDHFASQIGGGGIPITLYTPPRCAP